MTPYELLNGIANGDIDAAARGVLGSSIAASLAALAVTGHITGEAVGDVFARSTEPIEVTPEGFRIAPEGTPVAHHPIAGAIEKQIARTAGEFVGDPTNWPLLASSAARPLLQRAISGGLAVQMAQARSLRRLISITTGTG